VRAGDRATEFKQRFDGLAIKGVSHSYRYAWAKRALKRGYPERFAEQALGHNSKAVHHAYSKHAEVTVPCLDDWEKQWQQNPQRIAQPKLLPIFGRRKSHRVPTGPSRCWSQSRGEGERRAGAKKRADRFARWSVRRKRR
jgi:hypothetical protein